MESADYVQMITMKVMEAVINVHLAVLLHVLLKENVLSVKMVCLTLNLCLVIANAKESKFRESFLIILTGAVKLHRMSPRKVD